MKFKVGDKVKTILGRQVLTIKEIKDEYYRVEENIHLWAEDHLLPVEKKEVVEEQFEVGDIAYFGRDKVKLVEKGWHVYDIEYGYSHFVEEKFLKNKPLKEITEKELADMGYVIKR